ncbi:MAG TPA: polysaccharide deacetylase [Mycobacteriales bacterium]|nr:polysaccharide deacetylase [Mycobacteriales bacterium]
MRSNVVLAGALVVTLGVVLATGRSGTSAPAEGTPTGPAALAAVVPAFDPVRLKPGEKPPQFVIVSFDGAGDHDKWMFWRGVAQRSGARFTGFLSGVYLLDRAHRDEYTGPGHRPGASSLGSWNTPAEVTTLIADLNSAYAAGMEIGTHYNGHFCAGSEPAAGDWSTAAWTSELSQFFRFWTAHRDLTVPATEVRGGRTPCLEGKADQLEPALRARGFTYDTSRTSNGIRWPVKDEYGLWEFPLAYVPLAGTGSGVVSMDYNFWVKQTGNPPSTRDSAASSKQVLATYRAMYAATYRGNRAPLVLGNHFNSWNGNAYTQALAAFVQETCRKPETLCVPYRDVIAWMQAQTPAVLTSLQARPPVYTVG